MPDTGVKTLSVLAPAKINLYLHVTGRRDDGYHTIDSLVAFADAGDRIRVKPAREFSFSADGPFARAFTGGDLDQSENSGNLVVRAARLLAKTLQRDPALDIRLTKNLPLAAGIGGGSSDAAAVIWALLELWDTAPGAVKGFDELLLSLGADVPACMACEPVLMSGAGETLAHVRGLDEIPLLLVNPGKPCPTAKVFARVKAPYGDPAPEFTGGDLVDYLRAQRNDLTEAAITIVPEIADALALIAEQNNCLLSRMSGSGATCFGLFGDELSALDAAEKILKAHPDWWVRAGVLNRARRY